MTTVTLAQVAERAGVSTATVSMVLRNRGAFLRPHVTGCSKRWTMPATFIIKPPLTCVTEAVIRSDCCYTISLTLLR